MLHKLHGLLQQEHLSSLPSAEPFNEMRSLSRLNPEGVKEEQFLSLQRALGQRSNQLLNIIAGLGEWHIYAANDER